eukprot:COSAG05_NODE_14514_length_394_cov_34.759322_1_plen_69_part_01
MGTTPNVEPPLTPLVEYAPALKVGQWKATARALSIFAALAAMIGEYVVALPAREVPGDENPSNLFHNLP